MLISLLGFRLKTKPTFAKRENDLLEAAPASPLAANCSCTSQGKRKPMEPNGEHGLKSRTSDGFVLYAPGIGELVLTQRAYE